MDATAAVHPTDRVLQAYGLGKLDDIASESVSKHVDGCDSCQRRLAELSSDDFLGRLQKAQVTPHEAKPGWTSASVTQAAASEFGPPLSADTLPPELVDHRDWEIVRELGRGGMGVVYLARNKLMGRQEVLKVVGGHLIERPGVLERFQREIQSAARLQHPNIVTAYTAIRLGPSLVLSMEYVKGFDLAKIVKSNGPLPVAHAAHFVHQVALGLQHAHERDMVHRDIKPANLMVGEGKKAIVKILDFGLAKVTSEDQADSALTREGQMVGTPDYIAPEQIRDAKSADIRADIYSLGCTLYYLLSGGPPFRGEHLWDVYEAHFSKHAGSLNLIRPEVPVELTAVVAKMMAKEPGRRFQTPGDVARALIPFFNSAAPQPASLAGRTRSPEIPIAPIKPSSGCPAPAQRPTVPAAPDSTERRPPPTGSDGVTWQNLIAITQDDSLFEASKPRRSEPVPDPSHEPGRRPRWFWPALAGALLLQGLFSVWVTISSLKTSEATIELVDLPRDGEVLVDGVERDVVLPRGGKALYVTVPAGKRTFLVKTNGIERYRHDVTVQAGAKETLTVRLAPLAEPPGTVKETLAVRLAPLAEPPGTVKETLTVRLAPLAEPPGTVIGGSSDSTVQTAPIPEPTKNSIGMTFRLIKSGAFLMGSLDYNDDEKPQHQVRISRPFYLGEYEVTQAQYKAVMGDNPSWFSANGQGKDRGAGRSTDRHPVERVSWLDAVKFCNKLGEMDGLAAFYEIDGENVRVPDWSRPGYRLPTEAEWEYACRANAPTVMRYSFGDNAASLGEFAWYTDNSRLKTHPVGEKRPNTMGLFDMHGNVWEWCWDVYGESYYKESPEEDPPGPDAASIRVVRGGGWYSDPRDARSANRNGYVPGYRNDDVGFRLVLVQSGR